MGRNPFFLFWTDKNFERNVHMPPVIRSVYNGPNTPCRHFLPCFLFLFRSARLEETGRDCEYFTMMREPISRLVSAFFYCEFTLQPPPFVPWRAKRYPACVAAVESVHQPHQEGEESHLPSRADPGFPQSQRPWRKHTLLWWHPKADQV